MYLYYFLLGLEVSVNLSWLTLGSQGLKISQCSTLESMINCVCVSICTSGAKYSLLAYTTLCLPEAEGSFQSHSLIVLQGGKKQRHSDLICGDIKGLWFLAPDLIQHCGNDTIFLQKFKIKQNNP